MLDQIEEQSLLVELQNDDALSAFGSLQAKLEPVIRRFVQRLIGHTDLVDDVVQDVFIALYRHLDKIHPPAKLRPFLFKVARNRCYDVLRRRRPVLSLDAEPDLDYSRAVHYESIADGAQPPDETTHWLLLHLEVQQAIDKLPELQRQVLILYCEENLPYSEIAQVMNTNIGTVKSRLHYAKRLLRGLLKPETLRALENEFG